MFMGVYRLLICLLHLGFWLCVWLVVTFVGCYLWFMFRFALFVIVGLGHWVYVLGLSVRLLGFAGC